MSFHSVRFLWFGAIFILLCLAVTIIFLWGQQDGDGDSGLGPRSAAIDETSQLDDTINHPQPGDNEREPLRQDNAPAGIELSGRVIEKATGKPIQAFQIYLGRERDSNGNWSAVVFETVRNKDGRFSYHLDRGGLFRLRVSTSQHLSFRLQNFTIREDENMEDLLVELDRGSSVAGKVVEDATGAPVAGALVGPVGRIYRVPMKEYNRHRRIHTYSDAVGRFNLTGLKGDEKAIVAVHPDFVEEVADIVSGPDGNLVIRLRPGFCVFGKALSDRAEPICGLVIDLSGGEPRIPVIRSTSTASDGTYRTAPASPGPMQVSAHPPDSEKEHYFGFTSETKDAEIVDRDVEVNFGPEPNQIIWRGRLIDPTDLPVEGTRIDIAYFEPFVEQPHRRQNYTAVCDGEGFFEFFKLYPGRCKTTVTLPDHYQFDWHEMTFEEPGTVEKDIVLECGAIRGEVIDGRTGERINGTNCRVQVSRQYPWYEFRQVNLKKDGSFCLRGIPPGYYRTSFHGTGYPYFSGENVDVGAGRIRDGFRIVIPPFGRLRMMPLGFSNDERLSGSFRKVDIRIISGHGSTNGDRECIVFLEAGTWEGRFRMNDYGDVKRTIHVLQDETTDVLIRREEFDPGERVMNVNGRIVYSDGTPIPDAELRFNSYTIIGLAPGEREVKCTTDENGCFKAAGLRAGDWEVRYSIPKRGRGRLPGLAIRKDAPDPLNYEGVIYRGRITGRLYLDPEAARLLSDCRIQYNVWLKYNGPEIGKPLPVFSSLKEGEGRAFAFPFVPSGTFTVRTQVTGHKNYTGAPVSLSDGQTIDLGSITLEPQDFVILEVVDVSGNPVTSCTVVFPENSSIRKKGIIPYPTSKRHYLNDRLPDGPIKVRVTARGYKEKNLTFTKTPGRIQVVKVVLEAE